MSKLSGIVSETAVFQKLDQLLEGMEASGKVDKSAEKPLTILKDAFKEQEIHWLNEKEASTEYAFAAYHASRNAKLIIEQAITRLQTATPENDNPKIAKDTQRVLLPLFEIFTLVKGRRDDNLSLHILQKTQSLRAIAREIDLLPSVGKELSEVNSKDLQKHVSAFAQSFEESLGEV